MTEGREQMTEGGGRKDRGLEGEKKGGSKPKLKAQSDKTMVV